MFVVTRDGPNEAEGLAGSMHSSVNDVVSFILAYNSQPNSAKRSALVCINYVTKLSLNEKGTSVCRKLKPNTVSHSFR